MGRRASTAPRSPDPTTNEWAAVAFALPQGTSLGGVTTWSLEMSRQIAALTSRRGIILDHPTKSRTLVDARELGGVEVFKCGAFGHQQVTRANVTAYAACLPAVFVPNFSPGTYATCAALSQRSAEQMRVIGYCHAYHEYYFDLLRQYEPMIHRFVGVSSECFRRLRGLLPHRAADIVMRPYGVKVPEGLERTYSPPGQPIQLLYAGRIEESQKRVSALLQLACELTRQQVDYRLRIVGDGPDRASFVAQHASLDPQTRARVEIRPGVPPAEMPALLREADVAVLVSAYEGTSIFMLEAMAHGCVPVVTRVSGTADAIERNMNGAYAEVGDHVGLAAEIRRLSADRDSLARQGRQSYQSSLAYNDAAYFRWFNELCEGLWRDEPRPWPEDRALVRVRSTLRQRVAHWVPWARPAYRWVRGQPMVRTLKSTSLKLRTRTTHRPDRFRIFFIRGYMRSGTNWVCNLVNLHPQILSTGEFHLDRMRRAFDELLARESPVSTRLIDSASRESFESWTRQCVVNGVPWNEKLSAIWLGDRTPARLEPVLIEGAPSILVVRDGRDVLVSRTFHVLRRVGIADHAFKHLPRMREKRQVFLEEPTYFTERPHELLDDEKWVRSSARAWADHVAADRQTIARVDARLLNAPVLVMRFEELHADTLACRAKMFDFLGVDSAQAQPLDELTTAGFPTEDVRSHYRRGAVGDWRKYFTPTVADWYKEEAGEQLIEEGYEQDLDWYGVE